MTYTLTINIDNQGLAQIANAGEFVTIVQYVTQYAQSTDAACTPDVTTAITPIAVAWLSFSPFNTNTVVWTNSYAIFVMDGAPSVGTPITMNSQIPAQLGWTYTLQNNGFTQAAGSGAGYTITNLQGNSGNSGLYFGLAAQATINNNPPLWQPMNTLFVPYNQTGWFLPQEVSIFVSTCSTNGTAIPPLGGGTVIDFSSSSTATVEFNDANNAFV